jgi:hypothetical protein
LPVALVEDVRERTQCHRCAATESPKEAQSRVQVVEVQPAGVCVTRRWAKLSLTSVREKRRPQRRLCDAERDAMADRADLIQEVAEAVSWCGQDQSRPERVVLLDRKAEVVGSGVADVGDGADGGRME